MQPSGAGVTDGACAVLPIQPVSRCWHGFSAHCFSLPRRFSTPWCVSPSVKRTLLALTPRVSPMEWQRWRLNLASIASSTRRRSRNSFFSIIPAAAHGSAWQWIGRRQIYLPQKIRNPNLKIQNRWENNSFTHFAGMLRMRGSSDSRLALLDQHQVTNVNEGIGQISENADRIAFKDKVETHDHASADAPVPK